MIEMDTFWRVMTTFVGNDSGNDGIVHDTSRLNVVFSVMVLVLLNSNYDHCR